MFKFKFLLWMLSKLLQRAIHNNPDCTNYVRGKHLVFQIQTQSGVGRQYTIANGRIRSSSELTHNAAFKMTFRDGPSGFAILSAKESKEAFLNALHQQDLSLSGNFVEIMWFQGLTEYLQPKNK
jgi:hypothetical protein